MIKWQICKFIVPNSQSITILWWGGANCLLVVGGFGDISIFWGHLGSKVSVNVRALWGVILLFLDRYLCKGTSHQSPIGPLRTSGVVSVWELSPYGHVFSTCHFMIHPV